MDFYKLVVIIAIVILVIALASVVTLFTYGSAKQSYPPYQNQCPDYWTWNGTSKTCNSTSNKNIGTYSKNSYSPSDLCSNYNWAKTNNIMWDGVSNTNKCP
jgi:hypothetical protein